MMLMRLCLRQEALIPSAPVSIFIVDKNTSKMLEIKIFTVVSDDFRMMQSKKLLQFRLDCGGWLTPYAFE